MSVKGLPFKRQVDEFLEKKPSVFKDNMVYISMSKIWNVLYTASDASCGISMERASREFHEKYYVQFTWIWQITLTFNCLWTSYTYCKSSQSILGRCLFNYFQFGSGKKYKFFVWFCLTCFSFCVMFLWAWVVLICFCFLRWGDKIAQMAKCQYG